MTFQIKNDFWIEDKRNNKKNRIKLLNDQKCQSKSLGSIFCQVSTIPFIQSTSSFFWHETHLGKDVSLEPKSFAGSLPDVNPVGL